MRSITAVPFIWLVYAAAQSMSGGAQSASGGADASNLAGASNPAGSASDGASASNAQSTPATPITSAAKILAAQSNLASISFNAFNDQPQFASNSSTSDPPPTYSDEGDTTVTTPFFLIRTNMGTSMDTFNNFIQELDGSAGTVIAYPNVPWQAYQTANLTQDQIQNIQSQSFIASVMPVTESGGDFEAPQKDKDNFGRFPITARGVGSFVFKLLNLSKRKNAAYNLGILSAGRTLQNTNQWGDYLFDPTLGAGATIYVLDSGLRTTHQEFAANGRTIRYEVIPNILTLGTIPGQAPEDITDHNGHGTSVASVAVGVSRGVASKANLVAVKIRNAAKNPARQGQPDEDKLIMRGVTDTALEAGWQFVLSDVMDQRNNHNNEGPFIVNLSMGWPIRGNPGKVMTNNANIQNLLANNIVVILASGNDGQAKVSLDQITPQNLGSTMDVITVGGVDSSGILYPQTTPNIGNGGSITIYGGAVDVPTADANSDTGTSVVTGTSFAAPAIAGLGAYFFGLSSVRSNPDVDLNAIPTTLKGFFTTTGNGAAVQRNRLSVPAGLRYKQPDSDTILVAFNKAPEGLCNKKGSVTRRSSPRNFNRRRQTDETDGGFNSDSIDTEVIVNDQLVDDSTDDSLGLECPLFTASEAASSSQIASPSEPATPSETSTSFTGFSSFPSFSKFSSFSPFTSDGSTSEASSSFTGFSSFAPFTSEGAQASEAAPSASAQAAFSSQIVASSSALFRA